MLAPSASTATDIGAMRGSVSTQSVAIVCMGIVIFAAAAVAHPLSTATTAVVGHDSRTHFVHTATNVHMGSRSQPAARMAVPTPSIILRRLSCCLCAGTVASTRSRTNAPAWKFMPVIARVSCCCRLSKSATNSPRSESSQKSSSPSLG